jgi:hypothetical protein
MASLRRRLFSLSTDVENLYTHIFKQIEPEYIEESSNIFQIFRASGDHLDIFTLQRALLCRYHQAISQMGMRPLSALKNEEYDEHITWIYSTAVLRLASRCKGLLEIQGEAEDDILAGNNESLFDIHEPSWFPPPGIKVSGKEVQL